VFKEHWCGLHSPSPSVLKVSAKLNLEKPLYSLQRPTLQQVEGDWKVFTLAAKALDSEDEDAPGGQQCCREYALMCVSSRRRRDANMVGC
jgi:hypothetical protein